MKDKVVSNNSHVKNKKTKVEDHHRISSISNKTKSVTASTDSLKSRTLNVNAVCATCGKCVFNSNHDVYVSKYLNDVNARTKKPKVVLISTRKPKSQANKSVATPQKRKATLGIMIPVSVETRYNMNDSASSLGKETHNPKTVICANSSSLSAGWSSRNQRWRWRHLILAESDSLPHAHTQTTKTYYKHQDSSITKAQVLKTKTSANSHVKDNSSETKLQGRLLESFQDDAKYEHVGQDTRSQGGKDDQDRRIKI
ncbi:hypothetical protein Tco_0698672 [Tanacetum coccineum]